MLAADRARHRMVDALRSTGRVRTPAVEAALRGVPRHLFLPGSSLADAYADEAIAVQRVDGVATSSASQPSMVAIMLEQLDLRAGQRVLEIGAGTGYNAALMSRIVGPAGRVTSLDIDAELVASAAAHLAAAGVDGVGLIRADGALGHPSGLPYDRIVLTVGSSDVWPAWVAQLADGGRLLLPLALRGSQLSVALDLGPDGLLRSASVRGCAFIRLRGIGSVADDAVPLVPGLAVQACDDAEVPVDTAAVLAALDSPGPVVPTRAAVRAADVWDGLGLWITIGDPAAFRLLLTASPEESAAVAELFALGPGRGTVALTVGGGLAALVASPRPEGSATVVAVRSFGPDPRASDRLLALVQGWVKAGRPRASDMRLVVVPRTGTGPPGPARAVVEKEHSRVLVDWGAALP